MSATLDRTPASPLVAMTAGCLALVARPPLLRAVPDPTLALGGLFVVLLVFGAGIRLAPETAARPACPVALAVAVGVAAFGIGRVLGGGHPPAPLALTLVALNSLAAVAEEAFFRRLVFAALLPGGAAVAVAGSAALFALVHVPVYGAWVLPVDLAAGLVLSWQRWVTGRWTVPALTHVLANLLVVM